MIAEIVWTLESFYQLAKPDTADKVGKILNTPNLHVDAADDVLEALDLYVTKNVDFIDAYHGVTLRDSETQQILTHDKKYFGRMEWLSIAEP